MQGVLSPFARRLSSYATVVRRQAAEQWRPGTERQRLYALADALAAEARVQANPAETTVEIETLKRRTARLTLSREAAAG